MLSSMRSLVLNLSIIWLVACSQHSTEQNATAELAALMVGDFSTAAHVVDDRFVDQRRRLPAIGEGEWVYLQLNSGPEGRLYRQRVLQLIPESSGEIRQRTFRLIADADQRDLIADPQRLAALTVSDLDMSSALDCPNLWRRGSTDSPWLWQGRVDADQCHIFSERRQKKIAIASDAYLNSDELWLAERGFDLDGQLLWGTPEGKFSELRKALKLR